MSLVEGMLKQSGLEDIVVFPFELLPQVDKHMEQSREAHSGNSNGKIVVPPRI